MADNSKRFTVLWTARGREKFSAAMTEAEAGKFATKLRGEQVADVSIREGEKPPLIRPLDMTAGQFDRW